MKVILSQRAKKIFVMFIGSFTLTAVLLCGAGYSLYFKDNGVFSDKVEVDKYQVRSQLLVKAMNEVGVCKAQTAAELWANGLVERSAALQYSVMGQDLKSKYAKQLGVVFPNWVTGMSSPWVESFDIVKDESPNKNTTIFHIQFLTKTSTGPAGIYNAVLTIAREGDFWRIIKISTDKELYPYTGFDPEQKNR